MPRSDLYTAGQPGLFNLPPGDMGQVHATLGNLFATETS